VVVVSEKKAENEKSREKMTFSEKFIESKTKPGTVEFSDTKQDFPREKYSRKKISKQKRFQETRQN